MKKLLWIGDAACQTGFAKATHEVLEVLRQMYDVTVLGINYRGDPYPYPYPIYAAAPGGDALGIGRMIWMCDLVKPDVIIIQNDPWNFPSYLKQLKSFPEYASIPVVGIVAVDGQNCAGDSLNDLALAIFWTTFGLEEARHGGYTGPAVVVPLGVDTTLFRPMNRQPIRQRFPEDLQKAFIVGNINRNQPRKRMDLTVRYFATWIHSYHITDAYLYLHLAPTGDLGFDIQQLAQYYGIAHRLLLVAPKAFYGVPEQEIVETYNSFDVAVSTTQGEGFGLTALEAMACGVPCILPQWSALGEWADGAAELIPCTSTAIGLPHRMNVLGGVADEQLFVKALNRLYHDSIARARLGSDGYTRAHESRFRWPTIGRSIMQSIEETVFVAQPVSA